MAAWCSLSASGARLPCPASLCRPCCPKGVVLCHTLDMPLGRCAEAVLGNREGQWCRDWLTSAQSCSLSQAGAADTLVWRGCLLPLRATLSHGCAAVLRQW